MATRPKMAPRAKAATTASKGATAASKGGTAASKSVAAAKCKAKTYEPAEKWYKLAPKWRTAKDEQAARVPPCSPHCGPGTGPGTTSGEDDSRQRVMNMEVLCDYQGDIGCSLMDLVCKVDTHEATCPEPHQRDELVYYVVRFLELQARAGVSDMAMRNEIAKMDSLFDEYTGQRADEKGSPYAKLISIYWRNMRNAERKCELKGSPSRGQGSTLGA